MQFNCNGLKTKITEVLNFMELHDIPVAAIQETKLHPNTRVIAPSHTIIRQDHEKDKGGGLAFIIRNYVKYRTISLPSPSLSDETLEQQAIAIMSDETEIIVTNIYIPPISSCPQGYRPSIDHLLSFSNDHIIVGDIKAHNSAWYSALGDDARGTDISEQIADSELGILNEDCPTRVTTSCNSSPDISLTSPSLLISCTWKTETALNSDHLPIIISIQQTLDKTSSERRSFTNFSKADWEGFQHHLEEKFSRVPLRRNVYKGERCFRDIVNKAARIFIPSGRIPLVRPNFPSEAARLANERDALRKSNPSNPRIKEMNNQIRRLVTEHIRKKWRDHLDESSFKPNTKNLWRTIKELSNGQIQKKNVVISFNGVPTPNDVICANGLNHQFAPHPNYINKEIRQTKRLIHRLKPAADELTFTCETVRVAIKSTKNSKACGPDGLAPVMLKHLGPNSIKFLTSLFNLCLQDLKVPDIWKVGRTS